MSRTSTKETLAGGHFMSVINVLMQLRKVCNHPNLFESRPTVSAFVTSAMSVSCPTLVIKAMEKSVFEEVDLQHLNLHLPSLCKDASYTVERRHSLITPKTLIEEIDSRKDIKTEAPSHPTNLNDRIRLMVFERLFTSTNPIQQQKNASLLANRPASRSESPTSQHKVISTPTGTPVTAKSSLIQVKTDSTDSNTSRTTSSSQSITLQYQTAQGTRWATIPNGQIRHLPGGVVQIVTSGVSPRSATPVSSQNTLPPSDATTEADVNVAELSSSSKRLPAESYTKMLCRMTASKRAATLSRIHRINQQRCDSSQPYLPRNTIDLLTSITQPRYESSCSIPHYFWRD
uniref:SNF2 N-terminal domain-containing protein n=1 Tax=Ciona savignyi TaxID=51511 RepID=H2YBN4_CIOSA